MTEELQFESEIFSERPKRLALIVGGFVSRIVFDRDGYDDPAIVIVESNDAQIGQIWDGISFTDAAEPGRFAVVINGVVENVAKSVPGFQIDGAHLIASDTAQIGDLWDGHTFTAAPPVPITADQVNAERDRRIQGGFTFGGKIYQLDEKSISRITAMGASAKFAIITGAEEGDLFWDNPETSFGWIAADNTVTPMDAQTMAAFADAAKLWVSRMTFAAYALKQSNPIPQDFADDSYWSQA